MPLRFEDKDKMADYRLRLDCGSNWTEECQNCRSSEKTIESVEGIRAQKTVAGSKKKRWALSIPERWLACLDPWTRQSVLIYSRDDKGGNLCIQVPRERIVDLYWSTQQGYRVCAAGT